MSDLFRNAFSYIGTNTPLVCDNEFVGQEVFVNDHKVRIKKVIAEGGFAFVYVAQNPNTKQYYALKRLLATDKATCLGIQQEVTISQKLSGHPNIMKFISASKNDSPPKHPGKTEFLLLTELCSGGSLVDALRQLDGNTLSVEDVACIVYQMGRAVQHMHNQSPPVIHRDLKIENLLFGEDGLLKLCDFGSAMLKEYIIDSDWSATQRGLLEEEMASFTTPMYRAPEMLDTWNNYPITRQADIWAIGCVLYYLCYLRHPFEDSAKLRILNGNYAIPSNDGKFECFHQLIKGMLTVDPAQRFKIVDVLERLAAIGEVKGFNLRGPIKIKLKKVDLSSPVHQPQNGTPSRPPPPDRSVPQRPAPPAPASSQSMQQASGLFSSIKGYSGSIFKNLKDTSNKVMQTVSQSINRTELDLSYITSRIIAMSYPADGIESAYRNHVEDVKAVFEARHTGHYIIYNVSGRQYHSPKFNAKIFEGNWSGTRAPSLSTLYLYSCSVIEYFSTNPKNTVVIHCMDGKASSAVLVCSVLLLVRLFDRVEQALNLFAIKRSPPGLQPSQFRYLVYINHMAAKIPYMPHFRSVSLSSLQFGPIPLFTQRRDGVRPYVEIWQGDHKILSTLQDFESARLYMQSDRQVVIPLNVSVVGDITVYVYHARKLMGKVTGIKVAQVQFHAGFIPAKETGLRFALNELDDITEPERYPPQFGLMMDIIVSENEKTPSRSPPWISKPSSSFKPDCLFSSTFEMQDCIEKFGSASNSPALPRRPPRVEPQNIPNEYTDAVPNQDTSDYKKSQNTNQEQDRNGVPKNPPPRPPPVSKPPTTDMDFLSLNETKTTPKEPEIELLGSNEMKRNLSNFDLLSGFDATDGGSGKDLFDPFGIESSQKSQPDILGDFNFSTSTNNTIPNMMNAQGMSGPRMMGTPKIVPDVSNNGSRSSTPQDKGSDPFADLGLGGWDTSTTPKGTPVGSTTPVTASPVHQPSPMGGTWNQSQTNWTQPNPPFMNKAKTPTGTPQHQMKSPTANYARTNFDNLNQSSAKPTKADCFDDLLGSQGFNFTAKDSGPKTMGEMKKQEITKTMDPDKLILFEWTDDGKKNIRALLCSLHTILWEGAKWNECGMHQLINHNDVKKMYRKACLAVHPDKLAGSEREPLAKLIFMELNDAYTEFENDPSQQVFKK